MLTTTHNRHCLACNKSLKGRTDKKFCGDYCRNYFNNQLKSCDNNYVRNINNALKKNRRILKELLSETKEITKTSTDQLLYKGFQLKYTTHTYTNQKGKTYFFCYDYGYMPLENNGYLIVKRKEAGF